MERGRIRCHSHTVVIQLSPEFLVKLPLQSCSRICVIGQIAPFPRCLLCVLVGELLCVLGVKLSKLFLQTVQLALQVQQIAGAQVAESAIDDRIAVSCDEV